MSWQVGGITLPHGPKKISPKYTAYRKIINVPGQGPVVIMYGRKVDQMIWEGTITESGKTLAELEKDYINPLDGYTHCQVTVVAPGTRYDGIWILDIFQYWEVGGKISKYRYKATFIKGQTHVIIAIASLLTGDAASGQKIVNITNGSIFKIGMIIKIADDAPNEEVCTIDSISTNQLTMVSNLTNAYTTANNAKVLME